MVAGLWLHVTEAPVQRDPFDVAAFDASFPTPEQNKAGRALEQVLPKVPERLFVPELSTRAFDAIRENRWPLDDAALNAALDGYAAEPWFNELRSAVPLPLGVVDAGTSNGLNMYFRAQTASTALRARALQLMARGKPAEALELLADNLALSRQVRNKAPALGLEVGYTIERSTIESFPAWALSAGTQPDLLIRATGIVRAHDQAVPPLSETIKRDFIHAISPAVQVESLRTASRRVENDLETLLFSAPWEQWRRRTILATLCAGFLRTAELPFYDAVPRIRAARDATGIWISALDGWTASSDDPDTAAREYRTMARLIDHSSWPVSFAAHADIFTAAIASQTTRRAAILQLALAAYQARRGQPAAALPDLVPEFLPELPIDPYSGQSFHYRISAGEELPWFGNNADGSQAMLKVAPGQGIIWSVGPDLHDNGGVKPGTIYWRSVDNGADVIFLVPQIKKP
jgi:hypothetical protein